MARRDRHLFEATAWEAFCEGVGLVLVVGAIVAFFSLLGR